MARDLTAGMTAAIAADTVRPILLAEIVFASGTSRVWNGIGDIVFGANTYQGVGKFGSATPVQETTELQASGVTFSLSGIPADMLSIALQDVRWGKSAKLYFGLLNLSTGALIADPYLIFSGMTDVPAIDEGDDTATVSITAENRLVDLERPRIRRYTHEDQQLRDPGDLGFEYVASLQDASISWGQGLAE